MCDSLSWILLKQPVDAIPNFFLGGKRWKVFLVVCGTYVVGQILLLLSMPQDPIKDLRVALFAEVIITPSVACLIGWLWYAGSFLFSISEPSLRLNRRAFRLAIIFATLYLLTALPLFLSTSFAVIVPLHLLAILYVAISIPRAWQ